MKASQLREQALSKLLAAQKLVGPDDSVSAEDQGQFDALMAEFTDLDTQAGAAQTADDSIGTMKDRLAFYTQAATGSPLHLRETVLDPRASMSLGAQFVSSDAYKQLASSQALTSDRRAFRSDGVVMFTPNAGRMSGAATDLIRTGSGGGASALVLPDYLGGILPYPQRELQVRDLFSQGSTDSDIVSYAQQTGFDNGAAAVSQAATVNGSGTSGGVKPQSQPRLGAGDVSCRDLATWFATTRQALADPGQVMSMIDNQGRLMLRLEEEDQLLNGNGTSPNLSGIFDQSGLLDLDADGVGLDNLDAVRRARRQVKQGFSRAAADGIVVNPADSEAFDLLKDLNGQYRGGNPIGGPIGIGEQPIWRLRRVETEAMPEGTALVGAFKLGATVLERQPISVYTADQHADFFVRNLVVILFEERLGFPVFWPSAFLELTLGEWGS